MTDLDVQCSVVLSRKHTVATFHIICGEAIIYEHNPEVNSFAFTSISGAVSFFEATIYMIYHNPEYLMKSNAAEKHGRMAPDVKSQFASRIVLGLIRKQIKSFCKEPYDDPPKTSPKSLFQSGSRKKQTSQCELNLTLRAAAPPP
jgi:hypothetical protein